MENTLENKGSFYGVYHSQNVLRANITSTTSFYKTSALLRVVVNEETLKDNWYLELKPLTSITEEDAIEIGYRTRLHFLHDATILKERPTARVKEIDYLRSKGYAVPWMGLSVEQLIEYGWVKLVGDESN